MSILATASAVDPLVTDPACAAMLGLLLDGRAYPAGEIARGCGIPTKAVNAGLARLLEGGLVAMESEGPHHYYRLADRHVAHAVRRVVDTMSADAKPRRPALSGQQKELRFCRRCYDHMAGQVGVAITRAMQERGYISSGDDKQFTVTPKGARWFSDRGVDVTTLTPTPRGLARQCLDWTERSHHLGGPLGKSLMAAWCKQGLLRRSDASRAVVVTPKGWREFEQLLGVTKESAAAPPSLP